VADVGEEEALVDGNAGGVLVGGGVGKALVEVPLAPHVCLVALLLVVSLLPLLVFVPVTFTRIWTFSDKVTGLTTPVAHPFGAGLVVLPLLCLRIWRKLLMMSVISSLSSLEASIKSLLGVDSSFFFFYCFECNGLHLGCRGGVSHPGFKEQSRVHLIHAPKKTTYIITECIEIKSQYNQSTCYIAEVLQK
jgi:hypothetical protein